VYVKKLKLYGIAATGDFNTDGRPDLILCGNNYQVRPSLGRQDASYRLYLQGSRENNLLTQPIAETGLKNLGDSRKILTLKSGKNNTLP